MTIIKFYISVLLWAIKTSKTGKLAINSLKRDINPDIHIIDGFHLLYPLNREIIMSDI